MKGSRVCRSISLLVWKPLTLDIMRAHIAAKVRSDAFHSPRQHLLSRLTNFLADTSRRGAASTWQWFKKENPRNHSCSCFSFYQKLFWPTAHQGSGYAKMADRRRCQGEKCFGRVTPTEVVNVSHRVTDKAHEFSGRMHDATWVWLSRLSEFSKPIVTYFRCIRHT